MNNPFSHLFQPLNVGSIEIKNRIFSTGHMTLMLEGGGRVVTWWRTMKRVRRAARD